MSTDDDKINLAIWDVLKEESNCFNTIKVEEDTIYIIAVSLLTEAKCGSNGLYFVHASSGHTQENKEKQGDPVYSTAYVLPNNPDNDDDNYTNINYIDVPKAYRKKGIASKLLKAIESWCREEKRKCPLIRLDNDTDINPDTGLPSSLYEKAGYHYINGYSKVMFNERLINRPNGCEMEMVLQGGKHSDDCKNKEQFKTETGVSEDIIDEVLVCNKGIKKKRLHLRHIESKNIIGNLEDCVKTRGQLNKTKAQFSRRKYFKKSKRKSNRKSVRKSKRKSKKRKSKRKSVRKSKSKSRR
jgi:GNAT superfamily N-acetyltransferase